MTSVCCGLVDLMMPELWHDDFFPLLDRLQLLVLYGTCRVMHREVSTFVRTRLQRAGHPLGVKDKAVRAYQIRYLPLFGLMQMEAHERNSNNPSETCIEALFARHITPQFIESGFFTRGDIHAVLATSMFHPDGNHAERLFVQERLRGLDTEQALALLEYVEREKLLSMLCARDSEHVSLDLLLLSGRLDLITTRFPDYRNCLYTRHIELAIESDSLPLVSILLDTPLVDAGSYIDALYLVRHALLVASSTMLERVLSFFSFEGVPASVVCDDLYGIIWDDTHFVAAKWDVLHAAVLRHAQPHTALAPMLLTVFLERVLRSRLCTFSKALSWLKHNAYLNAESMEDIVRPRVYNHALQHCIGVSEVQLRHCKCIAHEFARALTEVMGPTCMAAPSYAALDMETRDPVDWANIEVEPGENI